MLEILSHHLRMHTQIEFEKEFHSLLQCFAGMLEDD